MGLCAATYHNPFHVWSWIYGQLTYVGSHLPSSAFKYCHTQSQEGK